MSIYRRPVILVGVDGSPQSLAAARWAATEAVRRRRSLELLHSTYLPIIGDPESGYPANFTEYVDDQGHRLLERAVREITAVHPDLDVSVVLTRSDPRRALVDASEDVALTVVGSLGNGRVREVLLGSVALYVTAHGQSPVAVVPYDMDPRQGPVLVGVDGRPNSEAAVGLAFDEASVRGAELVAVMAVDNLAGPDIGRRPITFDAGESQEERAVISEQLVGWAEKYPDVPVREYIFRGRPAECLLCYAGHAPLVQQPQLIAVGSRGRGGLTGLVLGSTSHAVIAHAACPVIVVRPAAS
jgi:nucleotide-binding universal stress UspA family protein